MQTAEEHVYQNIYYINLLHFRLSKGFSTFMHSLLGLGCSLLERFDLSCLVPSCHLLANTRISATTTVQVHVTARQKIVHRYFRFKVYVCCVLVKIKGTYNQHGYHSFMKQHAASCGSHLVGPPFVFQ